MWVSDFRSRGVTLGMVCSLTLWMAACGGGAGDASNQSQSNAAEAEPAALVLQQANDHSATAAGFRPGRVNPVLPTEPASPAPAETSVVARPSQGNTTAATRTTPTPSLPSRQPVFTFSLPTAANTSAGVYDSTGKLVRSLWRAEAMAVGSHNRSWDGLDDQARVAPAGPYELRLIHHNVAYQWEGTVGNSSKPSSGASLHKAFLPPMSLASVGDRVFYASGYNEAQNGLHSFSLADPQSNKRPARLVDPFAAVGLLAADAQRVYWANTGGLSSTSFVAALEAADGKPVVFAQGLPVCLNRMPDGRNCYADQSYGSVIGIETDAAWQPTGLAVQRNSRLLAVAHGGQNLVRLYDKTSGRLLGRIELPLQPKASNQIAFSPSGDLWLISGQTVRRYTALDSASPREAAVISGLQQPLAVTADSADEDSVWVADGGNQQLVRRYDRNGTASAVFGEAGGYTQDPAARPSKLCFIGPKGEARTALTVSADRALWVADTCSNRLVRLQANGRADAPLAYLPAVYAATVDMADARRVFANYLEFEVDVDRPLQPGQAGLLKRNWLPSLPAALRDAETANHGFGGFRSVLTFSNGRSYGVLSAHGAQHVVELPATGPLRLVATLPAAPGNSSSAVLYENGDLGYVTTGAAVQTVLRRRLSGFDSAGQPRWAAPTVVAEVPLGAGTPQYRGAFSGLLGPRFPITESGKVVFFESSVTGNEGFHLGAAETDGRSWLWMASPSGPLDGKGSFQTRASDPNISYGGNAVWTQGRHVLYGFHGEFYTDAQTGRVGQANQFMHYFDNGLFIGQFGVPSTRDAPEGTPGLSGNAFSPTLVRAGNLLYLYHNDESSHGGVHRWRIDGWNEVQEIRLPLTLINAP